MSELQIPNLVFLNDRPFLYFLRSVYFMLKSISCVLYNKALLACSRVRNLEDFKI